jgi:hypothetical protein
MAVRQRKVQQHGLNAGLVETPQGDVESIDIHDLKHLGVTAVLKQVLPQEPGILGAVFNHQHAHDASSQPEAQK